MLFTSIDFALFLPLVFILYWFVTNRDLRLQNFLLLTASYVFYGWWDWRFLLLLSAASLIDFGVSMALLREDRPARRKAWMAVTLIMNLGLLGFFKYYNFFVDSFVSAFSFFGKDLGARTLNIVLPVGISFYTFQTLSYTIEVYRRRLEPKRDIIAYLAYVSFFPQLVAGPIERATHLLPQFYNRRVFIYEKAADGMRQILWGLVKKMVIADNCARYSDIIFDSTMQHQGSTILLGAFFFTIQIYCDFSGYSDIALGTARLFGFELMKNFDYPLFARTIPERWRRWHISLTTWFKDYVYLPLGGSRRGLAITIRNTFIIFLLSGFWHGANWTFIAWGFFHALLFVPSLLQGRQPYQSRIVAEGKLLPSLKESWQMLRTFVLFMLLYIFFRAENIAHAFNCYKSICSASVLRIPDYPGRNASFITLLLVCFFLIAEWAGRENNYAIEKLGIRWKRPYRWAAYAFIVFIVLMYMRTDEMPFIYFQF